MSYQGAFQRNAFQNNAFQVTGDSHDGAGGGWIYTGYFKKKKKKIAKKYEVVAEVLPDAIEVISAIDPYIKVENEDELNRRKKAQYAVTSLPRFERINLSALFQNRLALDRLERALEKLVRISQQIKEQRKKREEEEFLLLITVEI